ncbi:MAG TPA: peptidoglycan-associated lipoprotein Pal [Steroidobacteraceae bacterium]|nr:peptidoglycan-associated lipoprotein Pal [Steroidobacteraceae bacterium]
MHKSVLVWIAVFGAALAAGCSSHKARPSTGGAAVPQEQSQTSGAENPNANGEAGANNPGVQNGTGPGVAGPNAADLQNRTIYFDFDSSEIKPEYNQVIAAHARYLVANTSVRVRLEGNTDERGSREYNIGLGERRAQAVRQALMLQGVADSQITTVSYGEERPAVTGHNEAAWAKNRRVDIVYLN